MSEIILLCGQHSEAMFSRRQMWMHTLTHWLTLAVFAVQEEICQTLRRAGFDNCSYHSRMQKFLSVSTDRLPSMSKQVATALGSL